MKIVYCVQQTYKPGGMERVLTTKVNWLARHGHTVTIVTTEQNGLPSFFEFAQGVNQIDLGVNYWENTRRRFIKKFMYFIINQRLHKKRLKSLLYKIQPHIVISMFGHDMHYLPDIDDGSVKILEYHFTHHRILNMLRPGLYNMWDRWNYNQIKAIIKKYRKFILLTDADKCAWGNEQNMMVIPNPLSFETMLQSNLISKKAIAIGRLVEEKGFDRLIDIWERVHKSCPDWTLEIVGSGPLENSLKSIINKKGLQHTIYISPATNNLNNKYLESSILLMTSKHEGLGMVIIEGQSYGLPCVCFDVPCGPAAIINNAKDGFLIPDGEINRFADKVCILMKNEDLRIEMGNAAKNNSLRFTKDNIMMQWERLFLEITRK